MTDLPKIDFEPLDGVLAPDASLFEKHDLDDILPPAVQGEPGQFLADESDIVAPPAPRKGGMLSRMIAGMKVGESIGLEGLNVASARNIASNADGVYSVRKRPNDRGGHTHWITRKG
jgi:hypothetical protein